MRAHASQTEPLFGLTEEEWVKVVNRVRYFTYAKYGWLPGKIDGGLELDDLVSEAVLRAVSGKRVWRSDVELTTFLCGIVRSVASHISRQQKLHIKAREISGPPEQVSSERPDENYQRKDGWRRLRSLAGEGTLAGKLVALLSEDSSLKPGDMASILGVPDADIYNAKKRLVRLAKSLGKD